VKKPLNPKSKGGQDAILNTIYEHQMLQVIRLVQDGSLQSFQEMFIVNEKGDKIVDYYAFRRRVSTLEDIEINPTSPYVIERAVFLSIQLFAALHSLNLFHGDIKPSNIMFGNSG